MCSMLSKSICARKPINLENVYNPRSTKSAGEVQSRPSQYEVVHLVFISCTRQDQEPYQEILSLLDMAIRYGAREITHELMALQVPVTTDVKEGKGVPMAPWPSPCGLEPQVGLSSSLRENCKNGPLGW